MNGTKDTKAVFIISIILSCSFFVTDNWYVKTIDFWFLVFGNLYFVYASFPSNKDSIISNLFKAVVISPFYEFGSIFGAVFRKKSSEKKEPGVNRKSDVIPVVFGLVFSIPLCAVVIVLLSSSDSNFGNFFNSFFNIYIENFAYEIRVNILTLVFSLPIAMYIFSAVYSRAYAMKNSDNLSKPPKAAFRILPSSACNAFLTPLTIIYIIFVLTQISYLFNVDTQNVDFSYSEYARSGFFELCFVVMINLSVISAVMFFVILKNSKLPVSVRSFTVIFSILTLCLIATALVKMMMYIGIYGMTPLRIYTSVFMAYLFVLFLVLIWKQFRFEISFTKTAYLLAAAVLVLMTLVPVDGLIAEYNIDRYVSGNIDWMGKSAMTELDASAVRVFCQNKSVFENNHCDIAIYDQIDSYLHDQSELENMSVYDFNLVRYFALKAVNKLQ